MAHWTDYIDLDATMNVAGMLGIETDGIDKRDLIENIMVRLMGKCTGRRPLIREPDMVDSNSYDSVVDFYITCHRAIRAYLRNLTPILSCREKNNG